MARARYFLRLHERNAKIVCFRHLEMHIQWKMIWFQFRHNYTLSISSNLKICLLVIVSILISHIPVFQRTQRLLFFSFLLHSHFLCAFTMELLIQILHDNTVTFMSWDVNLPIVLGHHTHTHTSNALSPSTSRRLRSFIFVVCNAYAQC